MGVCDIIRQRLLAMRIDPELAVSLGRGEEAATELAGMPDTRELPNTRELRASEVAVTEPDLIDLLDRRIIILVRSG